MLPLGVMQPHHAEELLAQWSGPIGKADRDRTAELSETTGISSPGSGAEPGAQLQAGEPIDRLLDALRSVRPDLTTLDLDNASCRNESLTICFDTSLAYLRRNPKTEQLPALFAMLGVFAAGPEAPFTPEAVAAVWQIEFERAKRLLERLVRAALLSKTESGLFYLHPLLGDYGRSQLEKKGALLKTCIERHAAYYLEIVRDSPVNWQLAEDALPQIRAAWKRAGHQDLGTLIQWPEFGTVFPKPTRPLVGLPGMGQHNLERGSQSAERQGGGVLQ